MSIKRFVLASRILGLLIMLIGCDAALVAAASVSTNTTLAMHSGSTPVSPGGSVASGSELILIASVNSGGTKVTTGLVNFCDASAAHCTDIHLLGTAQLTSAGSAMLRFHPGVGSHSYKAVFIGTPNGATAYAGSTSSTATLSVTGSYATTTQITQDGNPGNYTLTATVTSVVNKSSVAAPTGTVSFLDTTTGNSALATAALGSGTAELNFLNSSTPTLTQQANAVATADFNGDGIPDLAVSDSNSGQVLLAILLGNGDGTFRATQTSPTVGLYPDSIAVGDFNSDGISDLAVTSVDQNIVTILLGNGDGTFATAPNLNTSSTPQSVATADFNGDGIADLGVVNANSVLIYLGNGDGTFQPAVATPVAGLALVTVAAGDFNGDGITDLAVTNSLENGTVTILLGKGDGTFQSSPATFAAGLSPVGIAVADFNNDGILDLTISDYDGNDNGGAVTILLGNGDGTFKAAKSYSAPGLNFKSIAVGDFDRDGIPDLAVGEFWHGLFAIFIGKGDGTFAAGIPENADAQLGSGYIAEADFNGDGIPDLVLPSQDGNVPILLTQPGQVVTATVSNISPTGPGPHQVIASYPGDGNYASSISSATALTVQVAMPVFSLASGTYTSVQTVSITDTTQGATIYYSAPGTGGFVQYAHPITVSGPGYNLIQAYAVETGYEQSGYATTTYNLNLPPATVPVISLASGVYSSAQSVTISDATPGATIYYTTNGSSPTSKSAQYARPITVSSSETLVVTAIAYGYSISATASAQYVIASSSASLIYTIAGNGTGGYSGDGGQATIADINAPNSTVIDKLGNLYIADGNNNVVRKVAPGTGIITTVAGNGTAGYSGDGGAATHAELFSPFGLALDSVGNLYISDSGNNVIRKVVTATGFITTFAGNGHAGYSGDNGPATSASFSAPEGIATDGHGNLFIADAGNLRVRKIVPATGTITTVAGNGQFGYSGNGGPATSAELASPTGVVLDGTGNLYVADTENNVIRKVDAGNGVISTVAGNNQRGYSGDGGAATSAELYLPEGMTVDTTGNLYVADTYNQVIRKITVGNGLIATVAGDGNGQSCNLFGGDGGSATSVTLCYPTGVSVDTAGNLFIADAGGNRIRKATALGIPPTSSTAAPTLTVSAGTYASPQTVSIADAMPGAAIYVTMDGTSPTTLSPGYNGPINVSGGVTIKAIAVAPGYLISAPVSAAYSITSPPTSVITTVAGNGVLGFTGTGGPAASAEIGYPEGIASDSAGNLYFSDIGNNVIWMQSARTGDLSVIAGNGTAGYSGDSGPATSAQLNSPQGLAVDRAGNLYIADADNNVIRQVAAGTGVITTVAGTGQPGHPGKNGDGGPATSTNLWYPTSVALDRAGNLYISDTFNNAVRFVSANNGIINTIAGNGNTGSSGDGGPATSAALDEPDALAIDSGGNLYVATPYVGRVREIAAGTGTITTVAGNGDSYGNSGDGGSATSAEIYPRGLAIDSANNLYISSESGSIREVAASTGVITTIAGNGYAGYSGDRGSATVAELAYPQGISFDPSGNLYIADYNNHRVREVTFYIATATPVFSVPAGTYTSTQTITISDATPGATVYYTTDGTAPTTNSSVYTGPITISSSETIEAVATASGYRTSPVATAAYTINNPVAATPIFSPAAGTYTSAQAVTITDDTQGATIHYTTDGTAPTAGSSVYTGPLTVSSSETIAAVATASGYGTSAVATAAYTINIASNAGPVMRGISPAFTSEGGAAFTLTITGTGFTSGSTVYWGATALSTQYGSATQLTAQVPTSDVAAAGITAITVETPAPGGGNSNSLQFEVDSATPGSTTPPAFSTLTATVTPGSTATYPVTLPSSVTGVAAKCLNLPSGTVCSYSATTGAVTITTSATTPAGTYQITVVFTETEPGAAPAIVLLPVLLLPFLLATRKRASTRYESAACMGLILLAAMACMSACGGGGSSGSTTTPPSNPTHQVTSSGVIGLTVQ